MQNVPNFCPFENGKVTRFLTVVIISTDFFYRIIAYHQRYWYAKGATRFVHFFFLSLVIEPFRNIPNFCQLLYHYYVWWLGVNEVNFSSLLLALFVKLPDTFLQNMPRSFFGLPPIVIYHSLLAVHVIILLSKVFGSDIDAHSEGLEGVS